MSNIKRRVAVVTGGSSGIGLATVTVLLDAGFKVGFFGQSHDHVEKATTRLSARHETSHILARCVDLEFPAQITRFFDEVARAWGEPDTLVCNAGISPKGKNGATPFSLVSPAEWNQVLSVNLTGTMLCCQAVLPTMMTQMFGRIVLVGSIAGRSVPKVAGPAYATSKAALAGLSRSIVSAAAGSGVTVNVVAPGRIITPMTASADAAVNSAALERIPVGRLGQPDDVARAVAFLVSREAGFINGAIIDVNGGEFAPL